MVLEEVDLEVENQVVVQLAWVLPLASPQPSLGQKRIALEASLEVVVSFEEELMEVLLLEDWSHLHRHPYCYLGQVSLAQKLLVVVMMASSEKEVLKKMVAAALLALVELCSLVRHKDCLDLLVLEEDQT